MTAVIKFDPDTPARSPRRREAGTYSLMETPVVDFQKHHGSATSRTLTALAERANFKKPLLSVAEIQVETELGQRAVEKALVGLESLGFCGKVGKLWKYTNPSDPNARANKDANGCSHGHSQNGKQNTALDGKEPPLKEVEGSRRKYKLATGPQWMRWAGSHTRTQNTRTPEPANAGTADAAPQVLPSQESLNNPKATGETNRSQVGSDTPPPAAEPSGPARPAHVPENHGEDHDAVEFFLRLAGGNFTRTNRPHLARWAEDYSSAFLRLAWRLAPTLHNVRVPTYGMVFLLNREREWPDALKLQYQQDVAPPPPVVTDARAVQVGDRLRWPDSEVATVIELHSAQVVTDSADETRGYVRYDLIGKDVEVLQ